MQSRSVRWKLVDESSPEVEDATGKAAILHARARAKAQVLTHAHIPVTVHMRRLSCVQDPYRTMDTPAGVPPISSDKPNLFTGIDGFNSVPGYFRRRAGATRPMASFVGLC